MTDALGLTFAISLLIQAVFFAFAATLKTDKVTDLSYGLSFVIIAAVLLVRGDLPDGSDRRRAEVRRQEPSGGRIAVDEHRIVALQPPFQLRRRVARVVGCVRRRRG